MAASPDDSFALRAVLREALQAANETADADYALRTECMARVAAACSAALAAGHANEQLTAENQRLAAELETQTERAEQLGERSERLRAALQSQVQRAEKAEEERDAAVRAAEAAEASLASAERARSSAEASCAEAVQACGAAEAALAVSEEGRTAAEAALCASEQRRQAAEQALAAATKQRRELSAQLISRLGAAAAAGEEPARSPLRELQQAPAAARDKPRGGAARAQLA